MKWQQLIMDIYLRISQELELVLDGLTVDDLNQRPKSDCNSIGWLAWHMTRSQDRCTADLSGNEQLWIKDKWYIKFSRVQDPDDSGYHHSLEDITAFKSPDGETLLKYHHAVLEESTQYINKKLSESELDREIKSQTSGRVSLARVRILGVINDSLQHAGQAAYLRGLIKGKGWTER